MDLQILKYFLTVATEENITKAAGILHMTQPTLSRQIRQLEEELGAMLFMREKHRLVLTDDGKAFLRRATEITELVDRTYNEFRKNESDLDGTIAIGCVETRNMTYLGDLIRGFRNQYPHMEFEINTALTDEIEDKMNKGLLDLGVMMEPIDLAEYYCLPFSRSEKWGILVPGDTKLAQLTSIAPKDLEGVPLIFPARALRVNMGIKRWFGESFNRLDIVATYTLFNNAALLAKQGVGALLCLNIMNEDPDMKFIPLSGMEEIKSAIVWRKHMVISRACREFLYFCNHTING